MKSGTAGWGNEASVEGNVPEEKFAWLRQKKFLKWMSAGTRRSLQAAHLAWESWEGKDLPGGDHLAVLVQMHAVDSAAWEWREAKEFLLSQGEAVTWAGMEKQLPPLALVSRLPNSTAGHLAREWGAQGPCFTAAEETAVEELAEEWISDGECLAVLLVKEGETNSRAVILGNLSRQGAL